MRAAGKKKKRKKRKRDTDAGPSAFLNGADDFEGEGGFVEGGGFFDENSSGFVDDGDGGGFINGDAVDDGGGGFMDEDDSMEGGLTESGPAVDTSANPSASTSRGLSPEPASRIPLYLLPGILTSLGLAADDDVLAVFRASASGWAEGENDDADAVKSARRRTQMDTLGEENAAGVELKDFRAVCAALMGPDEGGDHVSEDEAKASGDDEPFELDQDSDTSLSSLTGSDGTYTVPTNGSRKGKGKARAGRRHVSDDEDGLEEEKAIRLTSRQREMAQSLWEMVKPNATGRGAHILGRDEVRSLARGLGEMWTEDEVISPSWIETR